MAYLMEFLEPLSSEAQEKQALASPEFREWEKLKADCDVMLEMGYFSEST